MESMNQWTVQDFLARASTGDAAPGGGSVAALAGALAAAMASMVANLTVGRPRYHAVEEECKEFIVQANDCCTKLQRLMDEDVRAFQSLMEAYRLPKGDTEEQVARRRRAIQDALGDAVEVPLATARASLDVLRLSAKLVEVGNVNAVSDAGVAASLGEAAVAAALFSVDINLQSMADAERAAAIRRERDGMADEAQRLRSTAERLLKARFGA